MFMLLKVKELLKLADFYLCFTFCCFTSYNGEVMEHSVQHKLNSPWRSSLLTSIVLTFQLAAMTYRCTPGHCDIIKLCEAGCGQWWNKPRAISQRGQNNAFQPECCVNQCGKDSDVSWQLKVGHGPDAAFTLHVKDGTHELQFIQYGAREVSRTE